MRSDIVVPMTVKEISDDHVGHKRAVYMICKLCAAEAPLSKSHIVPEFIFRRMYDNKHRVLEMNDIEAGKFDLIQKGHTERLLCAKCESRLNKFERHARRLFSDELPPPDMERAGIIPIANLKYEPLKLFILSVIWRASVSSLPMYHHVKLGRHEDVIRAMLLNEEAGAWDVYPCWIFQLLYDGKNDFGVMFEPTYARIEGHRCYRFVFGGFLFMTFVSSHGIPRGYERIAITPDGQMRIFAREFSFFSFLSRAWDKATEKVANIETSFGQE